MTTAHVPRAAILSPVATGVTIAVLALNLRPAVTSLGGLLTRIEATTGLSPVLADVLVALPTWCFAAGGWIAWRLRARLGIRTVITGALTVLTVSLVARTLPGDVAILAGTTAACLAIAVLGALLPVIVRTATPSSAACYTACLGAGSALGALLTPTGLAWQVGLGCWAILAAVALVIWIGGSRHLTAPASPAGSARAVRISPRSLFPRGTIATLTVHFGLLSAVTFVLMGRLPAILHAAGLTPAESELHFAAVMVLGVPVSLAVPYLTRRVPHTPLAVLFAGASITGVTGLMISPASVTWLWTGLLGLGLGALALALVDLGRRTHGDPDTTAALSSVVQGLGYTLAGVLALGVGLLETATAAWNWPLFALVVALVGQAMTGTTIGDVRAAPTSIEVPR
ncbi:MFS transporter [Amycolatopsis sp. H6(2020)]|nr:MFS transporter [Amycolatopsis sp. H6(2020)]